MKKMYVLKEPFINLNKTKRKNDISAHLFIYRSEKRNRSNKWHIESTLMKKKSIFHACLVIYFSLLVNFKDYYSAFYDAIFMTFQSPGYYLLFYQ